MTQNQSPVQQGQAAALPKTYAQHPLSAAFPAMTPEEFQKLKDSIENFGPMSPVVIANGMVLHGWEVYRACTELAVPYQVQELPAHVTPQDYLDAQNIGHKAQATNRQRVPLQSLQASYQPRPLNTGDVDGLAASIREVGLIQPITVRQLPAMHKGLAEQVFQIVAGHHRVAAARALGWTEIDAVVIEPGSNLKAELIEIDENLIRSELTPAQRAHYTARRAEIREALQPYVAPKECQDDAEVEGTGDQTLATSLDTLPDGRKKGPQHQKAFAAETAALTGQSKSSINQHRARGEALGDDALRVVGTSLDKGVELDALTKLPEPKRKELIDRAAAGEKVTARTVSVVPPPPSSAAPDPWDTVEKGSNTLPEDAPEDDGPSEEEMAEALASEKADRELVAKMLAADDVLAELAAEVKRLTLLVEQLTRRNNSLLDEKADAQRWMKKYEARNRHLLKEMDALKKGGA